MKCHICGKEMRVIDTVVTEKNDVVINTIETWWCDDCDGWKNATKRVIGAIFHRLKGSFRGR